MRSLKIEQRVNLKFLVKLKKSTTELHGLLTEVYKDDCMSCTQAIEWHKRFTEDQEEVEDNEGLG